ncbi:hypothetical protein HELRODRAFT_180892 [Helobdella robusta]|uniref:Uncharacterized protein n=1 Tax=Helobdella robusta TaxID=6412 RepID=T1FGD5_HELRO|nr:hypothetical protein HELRODRAFT_180892 [Helobdella robusta]ESN93573.1 hypothetical protein HELRODRAFT_180892 [Helobdella robusta]
MALLSNINSEVTRKSPPVAIMISSNTILVRFFVSRQILKFEHFQNFALSVKVVWVGLGLNPGSQPHRQQEYQWVAIVTASPLSCDINTLSRLNFCPNEHYNL